MPRTVEQTALLVTLLFRKSKAKRARVSDRTIRLLSKRTKLRAAFLETLDRALDDLGIHMIELERGGFGLIPTSALDGAETILAKNHISDDLKSIRQKEKLGQGEKEFARIKAEIVGNDDECLEEE
jgi:hypothetical protein